MFSNMFTLQAPQTALSPTGGSTLLVSDATPKYSKEKVVLSGSWQPPSEFSQWSPSSVFVDDVSYYCAERYMMAKKARPFQDDRAVDLVVISPDPRALKPIGRGVSNYDSVVWDRERQNAVCAGDFAKFTGNAARTHPLLVTF